ELTTPVCDNLLSMLDSFSKELGVECVPLEPARLNTRVAAGMLTKSELNTRMLKFKACFAHISSNMASIIFQTNLERTPASSTASDTASTFGTMLQGILDTVGLNRLNTNDRLEKRKKQEKNTGRLSLFCATFLGLTFDEQGA
ncbi:hypothetical protein BB560_005773, partial [Smittium megazygosporum]